MKTILRFLKFYHFRFTDFTVFPALSSPRMSMQYSSFWNMYLYNPDNKVYMLLRIRL